MNSTGSTIAKGVPVMFAGTNGASGKLLVQPWNGTGPSTYFMGLTEESEEIALLKPLGEKFLAADQATQQQILDLLA
jgi:hypothetical protein